MTVDDIIRALDLQPHPEGGYFAETWRAAESSADLPARYDGPRSHGTAIHYLLTPDSFSGMHRVASDEIFHFYLGDPVEQLWLLPDGSHRVVRIGTDLKAGERPQVIVPHGTWQGARLVPGGRFALLGCTVSPGFDFADFLMGDRDGLIDGWPAAAEMITALTR
ncbi:MAG: cupin domain-containing protein [Pseudomonadota bacterium]|nr:cupin domain-containing protein [Pseudomonadota bacterium]